MSNRTLPPHRSRNRNRRQALVGGQREINDILSALRLGKCVRFIGPRYHHKSQILREVCRQTEAAGFVSLYITLWDTPRTSNKAEFFESVRHLVATKARRYVHRRLPDLAAPTANALNNMFAATPTFFRNNVVLFIDDLEAAPPDYLEDLLAALRAAYITTATRLHFLAVVCASHSLARTALGPSSPFENISAQVLSRDLDERETHTLARLLLQKQSPSPTQGALDFIYEQTSGDRCVVTELCRVCSQLFRVHQHRLNRSDVRSAADQLLTQASQGIVFIEGLQQIENDPDLLETILILMNQGPVSAVHLRFDPSENPNRLITSGFIAHDPRDNTYRIKCSWYARLLTHHFTPERVGRLFSAAGKWQKAIDYLGPRNRRDPVEERSAIVHAAVGAMYSMETKLEAYASLARGLIAAYPTVRFGFYDLLEPESGDRILVFVLNPTEASNRRIPLRDTHRLEIKAIVGLHEYELEYGQQGRVRLLVPLRASDNHVQGLVTIDEFINQNNFRRQQEEVGELLGYLRQAARALKDREEYENLRKAEALNTRNLQQLLELTNTLMRGGQPYRQVLLEVLASAKKVISPKAKGGSVYLFDRKSNRVEMVVDLGYPAEIRPVGFRPGQGLAGHVFATGRPYIVRDTEHDRRYLRLTTAVDVPVRSAIGVPLIGRHTEPLGVLCLDNPDRTNAFDADSERWLMIFAAQVSPWLENLRLLDMLHDLNETIADVRNLWSPDPHQFYQTLAERLVKMFDLSGSAIGLHSAASGFLTFVTVHKLAHLPQSIQIKALPRQLQHTVLEKGKPLLISNLGDASPEWARLIGQKDYSSLLALPLHSEQLENSGLVLLVSAGRFDPSPDEIKILMSFAAQITLVLENARPINSHIEYIGPSEQRLRDAAHGIHQPEATPFPPDVLLPQIYDLMGLLFRKADKLLVRHLDQGMSGSMVLHIDPTWRQGSVGQRLIVKIGLKDKTRREEEHYHEYVEPFLPYHHATLLNVHYTRDLGALLYTIANTQDADSLLQLDAFYQRRSTSEIVATLRHLFLTTCRLWYSNTRKQRQHANLRELYLEAFELKTQPDRLLRELTELWPKQNWQAPTIAFESLSGEYPNPLVFLASDDDFLLPVTRCVTHGDLNAANIIVDSAYEGWLIDFYRTHESHILRDFVVLETDLKFRLSPAMSLQEFQAIEVLLSRGTPDPGTAANLRDGAQEELIKLTTVVGGLRTAAWSILGSGDRVTAREARREYLLSLFMATMNVLRLRYFKNKPELKLRREMALLSAASICQQLLEMKTA